MGQSICGRFRANETGSHYSAISEIGPAQPFFDDELGGEQASHTTDGVGFILGTQVETEFQRKMIAGKKYRMRIRTMPAPVVFQLYMLYHFPGLRFGMLAESKHDADLLSRAVNIAKEANYAIVFTCHKTTCETERQDQFFFQFTSKWFLEIIWLPSFPPLTQRPSSSTPLTIDSEKGDCYNSSGYCGKEAAYCGTGYPNEPAKERGGRE
ncbi:Beta-glucosidase B [Paramyrothecium foliicola]|nr:Beta-glucosidase B [Paramyrothecium foliicola]